MKRILTTLPIFFLFQLINAQQFAYKIDYLFFFDNRESSISTYEPETLFGMRLSPEIGLKIDDQLGGEHSIFVGASYIQPFGTTWSSIQLKPIAYYQYKQSGFTTTLGAIPYNNLKGKLPLYLWSESNQYYSPTIQGALFNYQSQHGFAEFFCDWRGMKSSTTREAFRLIANGEYVNSWFAAGGIGQLNHLANDASEIKKGVCDDITIQPYIKFQVGKYTSLDSLYLQTSYVGGFQRDRTANESYINHGFMADLYLKWRFIGCSNTFYAGDPIMPLYSTYGNLLNQGDANYQNSIYNRTDLFVYIIERPFVNLYFSWNIHYVPSEKIAHQQQLILRFNLSEMKIDKKNRAL